MAKDKMSEEEMLHLLDEDENAENTEEFSDANENGSRAELVLAPSGIEARVLEGASNERKMSVENRKEMADKIAQLEKELDEAETKIDKEVSLRRSVEEELDKIKRGQLQEQKKATKAKKERDAAARAVTDGINGKDLEEAREWRGEKDGEELRVKIDSMSHLHPDYECALCGTRTFGDVIPCTDDGNRIKIAKFKTLRELAALIDVANSGEKLAPFEVLRAMQDKNDNKDVTMNSMKKAYQKGLCQHRIDSVKAVQKVGVFVDGEDSRVSEAISEVLCVRGGRVSRKAYVLCVPSDSVVTRLSGAWKNIEETIYEDDAGLEKALQAMETAGSFPRSFPILMKNAFSPAMLKKIKTYLTEIVKKIEMNVYIGADILPARPSNTESAAVVSNHLWLASWKLENPSKNLIVMSQMSALIWTMIPLINIFVVAKRESKQLLESALMHIMEKSPFPFPEDTAVRSEYGAHKRPRVNDGAGTSRDTTPRRYDEKKCYKCRATGHFAWQCKNKEVE